MLFGELQYNATSLLISDNGRVCLATPKGSCIKEASLANVREQVAFYHEQQGLRASHHHSSVSRTTRAFYFDHEGKNFFRWRRQRRQW